MNRRRSLFAAVAILTALLMFPSLASAHNRARVVLPSGECIVVGALNEVWLGPDKTTKLDFDLEVTGDNFGASWAATRGNSALDKESCP